MHKDSCSTLILGKSLSVSFSAVNDGAEDQVKSRDHSQPKLK